MKKMKLEIDALRVESFRTGATRDADGTVRGHLYQRAWGEGVDHQAKSEGCSDGCTHTCASGGTICCA